MSSEPVAPGYAALSGARRRNGRGAAPSVGAEYTIEKVEGGGGVPSMSAPSVGGGGGGASLYELGPPLPLSDAAGNAADGWLFRGVVGCTLASIAIMLAVLTTIVVMVMVNNYASLSATATLLSDMSHAVDTTMTTADRWVQNERDRYHVNSTLSVVDVATQYLVKVMEIVDASHDMTVQIAEPFDSLMGHLQAIRGALESSDRQGLIRDIDELSKQMSVLVAKFQDMGITLHIGA